MHTFLISFSYWFWMKMNFKHKFDSCNESFNSKYTNSMSFEYKLMTQSMYDCEEWKWTFTWTKLNENVEWTFKMVQSLHNLIAKVVNKLSTLYILYSLAANGSLNIRNSKWDSSFWYLKLRFLPIFKAAELQLSRWSRI